MITASIPVGGGDSPSGRAYEIQDGGAPVIADWMWESLELPKVPWRMRRTILREIRGALVRRRDTNLSAELSEVFGDRSANLMPVLGHGRDIPNGRYVLDGGRLDLDWSSAVGGLLPRPRGLLRGDRERARRQDAEVAVEAPEPLDHDPPAGRRGDGGRSDARRGEPVGEVFGFPGLYVADGAAMPGPARREP